MTEVEEKIKIIFDDYSNNNIKKLFDENMNNNIKKLFDENMNNNIKKLFDENMNNNIKNINEQISGVFLYGFITGVVASYSGFLSYGAGILTGIMVCKKYDYITSYIAEQSTLFYQTINNKFNHKNK